MSSSAPAWQPAPVGEAPHRRVLIVDDSAVARAVLARLIDASDDLVVSRSVATVEAALAFLTVETVDYILLDIHMPGTDGLTGLPDLIAAAPGARIVVVSGVPSMAMQALALGAAHVLTKPGPSESTVHFGSLLVETLTRLSQSGAAGRSAERPQLARPETIVRARPAVRGAFDLVAIGASTGGIHAISGVLRALPASCRLPILVTQHLPASFMPYFAAQLALLAGRPCDVATDCLRVRPGRVVVAPGDAHLRCVAIAEDGIAIRLSREPVASGCLPSVDPMLASLAAVLGERLLAVILSGMGRDGADGARAVAAAGGCVVAQDCESSVVWGMPGAVVAAGIAAAVLPPDRIGALVASGARPQ